MAFFQIISQYMQHSDLHIVASIEEGRMVVSLWPKAKTPDKDADKRFDLDIPPLRICDTPTIIDDNIEDILKEAFEKLNEVVGNVEFIKQQIKKAGNAAIKSKSKKTPVKPAGKKDEVKATEGSLFGKRAVPEVEEGKDKPAIKKKSEPQPGGEKTVLKGVVEQPVKPEVVIEKNFSVTPSGTGKTASLSTKKPVEQGLPGAEPSKTEEKADVTPNEPTLEPKPIADIKPEKKSVAPATNNDEDW